MVGRVINTESAGKDRNRLSRSVVLAIRELMKQSQPDDHSRELAAFVSNALLDIAETIDVSVAAWEKRGYWVKADRFRMDWAWTERMGKQMQKAVLEDNWMEIAQISVQTAQKFMGIQVPEHHRLGTPWVGAWEILQKRA